MSFLWKREVLSFPRMDYNKNKLVYVTLIRTYCHSFGEKDNDCVVSFSEPQWMTGLYCFVNWPGRIQYTLNAQYHCHSIWSWRRSIEWWKADSLDSERRMESFLNVIFVFIIKFMPTAYLFRGWHQQGEKINFYKIHLQNVLSLFQGRSSMFQIVLVLFIVDSLGNV